MKHSNQLMKGLVLSLTAATAVCAAALTSCSKDKEAPEIEVAGVAVSPSSLNLTEGQSANLTAAVSPSNATDKTVTWSSSNAAVATVNGGTVTAVKAGTATITAKAGGKSATASVTVRTATVAVTGITLDKTELALKTGETATLTATVTPSEATDKSVIWTSDNALVASADASGKVTALKAGSAVILATTADGSKSAKCEVVVTDPTVSVTGVTLDKSSLEIAINGTAQLTATVLPDNATDKSLTWESSNPLTATVSASGLVTGKATGSATITVTTKDGGKTATCKITVTSIAVTGARVSPSTLSIEIGSSTYLTLFIEPDNATNKNVTWKSSDETIATVSASGRVTGAAAGSATVTATTEDGGFSATCAVTVAPKSDFKGSGTKDDPFQISTRADLDLMATKNAYFKDNYFLLMNDIDLGGPAKEFIPIGQTSYFKGHFDGNGKTISGLYVNQPSSDRQGLFANIYGAEIKNLTVSGSVTGKELTGGIVGYAYGSSVIYNCTSDVTVTGERHVAGITGWAENSNIVSCCNTGTVKGTGTWSYAAGICGRQCSSSNVAACYNTGAIISTGDVGAIGGITGVVPIHEQDILTDCYNRGTITGTGRGGILGCILSTCTDHCYYLVDGDGTITAVGKGDTGLLGAGVSVLSKTQMTDGTMLGYLNAAAKAYNAANPSLPQAWEWKAGTDGWPVFNVGTVAK